MTQLMLAQIRYGDKDYAYRQYPVIRKTDGAVTVDIGTAQVMPHTTRNYRITQEGAFMTADRPPAAVTVIDTGSAQETENKPVEAEKQVITAKVDDPHIRFLESCQKALVECRSILLAPRDAIADEWFGDVIGFPSAIPNLLRDRLNSHMSDFWLGFTFTKPVPSVPVKFFDDDAIKALEAQP